MTRTESRECRDLLTLQNGVLARWQLPTCGLDPATPDALLRRGRWRPVYRGVYASFTGPLPRESLLWAAVLRCGPDAALSHLSAAEADGFATAHRSGLHVTVAAERQVTCSAAERRESGAPPIVVHRSGRIEQARHPVKTPPRTRIEETVLDLAQVSGDLDEAVGWITVACGRRLTTPDRVRAVLAARGKLRWRSDLDLLLDDVSGGVLSVLENRYVHDVERPHGLPVAVRQVRVVTGAKNRYLDNLYGDFGLGVELDGLIAHPEEVRWRDNHRGNALLRAGIVLLRYHWLDVTRRACQTAREIADVLHARGWTGRFVRCRQCPS